VLEQRRDRGIVLGAGNEHAAVRRHDLLELQRVERRPRLGGEVGVVDRQRIVGKRDARDLGCRQQQFLGRQRRQPAIVRAAAQRARNNENFRGWHGGVGGRRTDDGGQIKES